MATRADTAEGAPELLRCSIVRGRNAVLNSLARELRPISHSADEAPEPGTVSETFAWVPTIACITSRAIP